DLQRPRVRRPGLFCCRPRRGKCKTLAGRPITGAIAGNRGGPRPGASPHVPVLAQIHPERPAMERRSFDLDYLLDEAFAQVLPNGKSLRMNRAFRALASACGAEPELASIFGPGIVDLLSEADSPGRASAFLPALAAPERD